MIERAEQGIAGFLAKEATDAALCYLLLRQTFPGLCVLDMRGSGYKPVAVSYP